MHGPAGIIPTRGQIVALRADAPVSQLTKSSWSGNEGFEYWFPRPLKPLTEAAHEHAYPLVIFGGGREASGPKFEYYEEDDSVLNADVGRILRNFLHNTFPRLYQKGREPEMEWVSELHCGYDLYN